MVFEKFHRNYCTNGMKKLLKMDDRHKFLAAREGSVENEKGGAIQIQNIVFALKIKCRRNQYFRLFSLFGSKLVVRSFRRSQGGPGGLIQLQVSAFSSGFT
jgi:hypothetical protein